MGISILELVLRELRQANFVADIAYPGQKYPVLTEPVAAVHLQKVDRAGLTVTVEVNIICPAACGGTTCELEALRATEVLRWAGAVCIQNGCSYDGLAQVYQVSVLATFTGITEADDCTIGPGFQVRINHILVKNAVSFTAEGNFQHKAAFAMGENEPVGLIPGSSLWKLRLEEVIPAGTAEVPQSQELFSLELAMDIQVETYSHCRWHQEKREFTREGLRRVREGIAMAREVRAVE